MFVLRTSSRFGRTLLVVFVFAAFAGHTPSTAQTPSRSTVVPASSAPASFDHLVDSAIRQERRLAVLMRNFKPVIETYIQEETPDTQSPRPDDYFLSRLDLTGDDPSTRAFVDQESWKETWERKVIRNPPPFTAAGFAQALFPDLNRFDRANYAFEFVRWETLGDLRCGIIDVKPLEDSKNRGFVGRIWVEDQDFNIVRFTGAYTSKALSKRSFHFDSWRLNTLGIMWMPAYIYTQESKSQDPANHDLWFKAQTRIWGYDLQHAGDHREFAKPLTDNPVWVDPKQHEASQDVSPANSLATSAYSPEDNVVERLQVAGLMAPDGTVDAILQAVTNNLLITNNLDIAGVRCRVLLTTPLESFVVGRTIVLSRGLLDVLPDEATLAVVLAHELAHIVLRHSLSDGYTAGLAPPFSDLEIYSRFSFHFTPAQEGDAEKKALELFSNSPYSGKLESAGLFQQALAAHSAQLPNLLHARFSNDFGSGHLTAVPKQPNSRDHVASARLDQVSALPLGSRIVVDPWSDRIEMLKSQPVRPLSAAEKMPFEVSPFFPFLKRLNSQEQAQAASKP